MTSLGSQIRFSNREISGDEGMAPKKWEIIERRNTSITTMNKTIADPTETQKGSTQRLREMVSLWVAAVSVLAVGSLVILVIFFKLVERAKSKGRRSHLNIKWGSGKAKIGLKSDPRSESASIGSFKGDKSVASEDAPEGKEIWAGWQPGLVMDDTFVLDQVDIPRVSDTILKEMKINRKKLKVGDMIVFRNGQPMFEPKRRKANIETI